MRRKSRGEGSDRARGWVGVCRSGLVRTFSRTNQFKKDVKRAEKRGKNMAKLKTMLERLAKVACSYSALGSLFFS